MNTTMSPAVAASGRATMPHLCRAVPALGQRLFTADNPGGGVLPGSRSSVEPESSDQFIDQAIDQRRSAVDHRFDGRFLVEGRRHHQNPAGLYRCSRSSSRDGAKE